jgi:DNA-binding protein H-NS
MTTNAKTLQQLIAEYDALGAQIEERRATEKAASIETIRAMIKEQGLTQVDIFPVGRAKNANTGVKVAAKYRDPASGQTWTGRGKPPKWISEAADRTVFEIKDAQ